MRYQPPTAAKDKDGQFAELSRVLEQPSLAFAPDISARVGVAPGEIKRLSPRASGQTVLLQAAAASNAGQSVALFVSGLGALTVLPVSGTINGASQLVFAAGTYSLELLSDGERWLTPGLSTTTLDALAGAGLARNGTALDVTPGNALSIESDAIAYSGSTSRLVLSGATGNLGTVDITTLACGGSLFLSGVAGDWQIEGFTSKPAGFWFNLAAGNTAFTGQLLNEDATATAALRLRLSGFADSAATLAMQALIFRNGDGTSGMNRWSCIL